MINTSQQTNWRQHLKNITWVMMPRLKKIMFEVDRDKDGRISYEEFCATMKTGTHLRGTSYRNLSHIFIGKGKTFSQQ
ncbi:hypothetical protein AB3S75_017637 [Citrus x aurantiifolia]